MISHTDENAFDVFYEILGKYMIKYPEIFEKEKIRQEKYHKLQLNTEIDKIEPTDDYLTSGTLLDYIKVNKEKYKDNEVLKHYLPDEFEEKK